MSQPSLVPAPPPHQEHAVRFELTITGFADQRLNQLDYACEKNCELRISNCGFVANPGAIRNSKFFWYRRRESNPHQLVSKTSASARLGYAGEFGDRGLKIECSATQSSIFDPLSSMLYPLMRSLREAGAGGVEPPSTVLETTVLPVTPCSLVAQTSVCVVSLCSTDFSLCCFRICTL
jgi:hypothetical protein